MPKNRRAWTAAALLSSAALLSASLISAGAPPAQPVFRPDRTEYTLAAEVDRKLNEVFDSAGVKPAPRTSDEDFLRRVSIDLAGTIPTAKDVTLFSLDPDPDKRAKLIDRLLASDGYAELWASYWSDVIFSHATEPRSRSAQGTFEEWMKKELAADRPWSEIATKLLTATGSTQDDGQTALVFAHLGDAEELAAESSRIFLGIQIQCANCHDHPTDGWKREQFHQLAAFFPRITVRREKDSMPVEFVVTSFSGDERRPEPAEILKALDRNRDGKITASEAEAGRRFKAIFKRLLTQGDANKDGALTEAELKAIPKPMQQGRGAAEHFMSDLQDPNSKGTMMQPAFFVNGAKVKPGSDDLERREAIARYFTAKGNPWFRKAFVNRMWAELLGEGFYMPIDDMGPQRQAQQEEVLNILATGFAAHDYDVKWILRTITNTQAYQRQLAPQGGDGSTFAAASPTRFKADQIYSALTQVLGVSEIGGIPAAGRRPMRGANGGRRAFQGLFGFDPSTPQADIIGNIPQALFLMNAPGLAQLTRGSGDTALGRILKENKNDSDALNELYLRVLSREPTEHEQQIVLDYVSQVGNRTEAFEDVFWSLLNSSEFMTKR
jgi:hypothetical protein